MIDVEIRNFQAIDFLALKVEGFTALVGRSNIGKSSIVRALKCALSGGSGSDFVRHDARTCTRVINSAKSCKCFSSVKLGFGEGQGFLWEKGSKGLNRYTVWKDGVESVYDRVGQSIELQEFLGSQFAPVKLGPSNAVLQVSSQFEAPFLLDLSGNIVADILSDVGQLDDINQAMAAVSKDRRSAIATRKVREADLKAMGLALGTYEGLDAHLKRVRSLQSQNAEIKETERRGHLAGRLITEVTEVIIVIRRVNAALAPALPDASAVLGTSKKLGQASVFVEEWEAGEQAAAVLSRALAPALPAVEALTVASVRWSRSSAWEVALLERERLIEHLKGVESVELPLEGPLRSHAVKVTRVEGWLREIASLKTAFVKGLEVQRTALPELQPVVDSFWKLSQLDLLARRLTRLSSEVTSTEELLSESESEGAAVLAEFSALGLCPTCRQNIGPEHGGVHG